METIPTATDRVTAYTAAEAAVPVDDAAQKAAAITAALVKHFEGVIMRWASASGLSNPQTLEPQLDLSLPAQIDAAKRLEWRTALEAKGYTVTEAGSTFSISITIPP